MLISDKVKQILEERGYSIKLEYFLDDDAEWFDEIIDATIEAIQSPASVERDSVGHDGC